ncbi:SUKH-4 family immunity protein [Streptomyces sp. NPDC090442]|uniref:SUKH-4 family immunity protein n=1 Tax=Streptomyces sp. NPDC090442 TaxID=3365962 RepID=UPI0037F24FC1
MGMQDAWGRTGAPVRRWHPRLLAELGLPGPVGELLATVGVPEEVGPYFRAADEPDLLTRYTQEVQLPRPVGDATAFWRLGDDSGSHICCAPSGAVFSASGGALFPTRLVNSSAQAWLTALAELGGLLGRLSSDPIGPGAVAAITAFRDRLAALDPEAMSDEDNWWPLVTDDLRLTASVDASGIFEFRTDAGATRTVSGYSLPGQGHVSRRLGTELLERGIEADRVTRIHADLEPCELPGCYCAEWLAATFPEAEVSYSFDYGPDADGRAAGIRELAAFIEESEESGESEGSGE